MSINNTIGLKSLESDQVKDTNLDYLNILENKPFATRNQLRNIYKVQKKTLSDNIKRLKVDGLVKGVQIRLLAKDGKQRIQEVFDLNEVIAIGFRLRSDTAIKLQRYAANNLQEQLKINQAKNKSLELEIGRLWNKMDIKDLYR
ncbi:hypothetical protein PXD56_13700 [Maribacter sp. SA7]|uniref:hypothetical protein n=1 Tax=Maribacter zhoushanensis TaxID=3030012 RepID=UPI0023EC4A6F|nr:hypothetical protein [Maribacter zhoushanensis]MDF4204022.1 hypothetical protein [Maribacter zhoushanensis]